VNVSVRSAIFRGPLGAGVVAGLITLTACGQGDPAPAATDPAPPAATGPGDARQQLAALAAAAKDRKLTATYTLSVSGRPDRTVVVTSATDGSWRIDIPEAALGGTADVSMAQNGEGIYQCALPSSARPVQPTCVRVAKPGGRVDAKVDPRVWHPFTDSREVLIDRDAPLAVSVTKPISGAQGTCFSVESTTTSLKAPLDVGIYCYDGDGTLTAARLAYGTLKLANPPAAAPATITLAGPVVGGEALGMAAPPTPSASASPSGSPSPSPNG
jgi:hypothetical protein